MRIGPCLRAASLLTVILTSIVVGTVVLGGGALVIVWLWRVIRRVAGV
jgi:hypothetical protein